MITIICDIKEMPESNSEFVKNVSNEFNINVNHVPNLTSYDILNYYLKVQCLPKLHMGAR